MTRVADEGTATPTSTGSMTTHERPGSGAGRRPLVLAAGAAVLAATAAVVAAGVVGGPPGGTALAEPGAGTRWAVLLLRTAQDLAAILTLGVLAVAVVLLPAPSGVLSPVAVRLVRLGSRWAACWALAAAAGAAVSLSQATALSLVGVLRPDVLALALDLPQTRALVSTAWLAGTAAVWARGTTTTPGARLLLLIAASALLPPLLGSHAAHGRGSVGATATLVVHVAAAAFWAGGLAALALHLRRRPAALAAALPHYSRLALVCFLAVGLSGALAGAAAFASPAQLWTTPYGQLLTAKVLAFALLGVLGHRHRRRTLGAVERGRPHAFLALAAAELVLMAGVVGLAVGLSHAEAPAPPDHGAVTGAT